MQRNVQFFAQSCSCYFASIVLESKMAPGWLASGPLDSTFLELLERYCSFIIIITININITNIIVIITTIVIIAIIADQ